MSMATESSQNCADGVRAVVKHCGGGGTVFLFCQVLSECWLERGMEREGRHGGELAGQRRRKNRRAVSLTVSLEEANKTLPFPLPSGTQFPYAGLGDP